MEISKSIRVVLIEGNPAIRTELRCILGKNPLISFVGESGSVSEARQYCVSGFAEVVIMDIDGSESDASRYCFELKQMQNPPHVLFLTADVDSKNLFHAIEMGGDGCLELSSCARILVSAIICITNGKMVWPSLTAEHFIKKWDTLDQKNAYRYLTPIEEKISELVACGKTNREIGEQLGRSAMTVRNQLSSLMAKLGLDRRSQVAALFARYTSANPLLHDSPSKINRVNRSFDSSKRT